MIIFGGVEMEYLIVKAVVLNLLKDLKESKVVVKDLDKLFPKNKKLNNVETKLDIMIREVNKSLEELETNKEFLSDCKTESEILGQISFKYGYIKTLKGIQNLIDEFLESYIEYA